jgi:hypothetical protein
VVLIDKELPKRTKSETEDFWAKTDDLTENLLPMAVEYLTESELPIKRYDSSEALPPVRATEATLIVEPILAKDRIETTLPKLALPVDERKLTCWTPPARDIDDPIRPKFLKESELPTQRL